MAGQEPVRDVRQLSRLAYGFMASKALFVALETGLFTELAQRPMSRDELSSATGLAQHRLATLLSALSGVGLVVRGQDGRWGNAPAVSRYLVDGAPEGIADYYRLQIDALIYPMLQHLSAGVRGDESRLGASLAAGGMSDPKRAAMFSRAQHVGSLGPAALLARRVDLSGASHLLDVAGGTGAMSIALCRRYPDLTATIIDFPNVVEIGREYVSAAGLEDRVRFVPAGALDVEWPRADVVLMSYLLSAVAGDDILPLLQRAAGAARHQRAAATTRLHARRRSARTGTCCVVVPAVLGGARRCGLVHSGGVATRLACVGFLRGAGRGPDSGHDETRFARAAAR